MVGLVFGLTLQEAFGDYFKTINLRFIDNPNVCIFEPEYDEDYFNSEMIYSVFSGIKEWETTLEKSTKGDWYLPIYVYQWEEHIDKEVHDYLDCQIIVSFEQTNDGSRVGNSALGYTYFDHSWSKHKYAHIVIFTETVRANQVIDIGTIQDGQKIVINLQTERIPNSDIHHIMKHEFGHSIGLLHHYNSDISDDKRSVMDSTFEAFKDYYMPIQPRDVHAIVELYGEDGWANPNPIVIPKKIETMEWFIPLIDVVDLRVLLQ
jgi:hypothetical protein